PQGTLSGRLTRARALLARRLASRGVPVTTAALAALLARDAAAAVPPSLLAWTARAGAALAAGAALTEAAVSSKVASLVEGVLKMLLLSNLKPRTGGFLLLAAVAAVGWACAARVSARAGGPGDEVAPRTEEEPARTARATNRPTEAREAEFVFRGAARG